MNIDYEIAQAVRHNDLHKVKELHLQGANLRTGHELLLRTACEIGNLEIVAYLIENGARMHTFWLSNIGDMDSLMLATYNGHRDIVEYLLQNDDDIQTHSYSYNRAYDIAVKKNFKDIYECIYAYAHNYIIRK